MKQTKLFPFFILFLLLLTNCSKTKRGEIGQGYQNFNSRYNTYFNAKEKFYISYNAVKSKYKDNYSNLLPLFEMDNSSDKFMAQTDMNIIEDKAGKVALKYYTSRWADNAIMLWGKTLYLRGEYLKAINVFTYITAEYKKGFRNEEFRVKKGSKISKKEQKLRIAEKSQIPITEGFFEHTPRRNEALLWLSRAYIQLEKFNEAQSIISYAESDMTFPLEYRVELVKVQADLYIKRNNYPEAIKILSQLILKTKSKKLKSRYYFISGQIYELINRKDSAFIQYENVLLYRPDDDMEFYAKIKLANLAGGIDPVKGEALLMRMIKDQKNEDYLDILYHKLGLLKKEHQDFQKAEDFFKKSISLSKNNQQKAWSFQSLALLYEEKENYIQAHQWYDSSLALYDNKLSDFKSLTSHAKIIADLSAQQTIIFDQDSLQVLAKMGKEKAVKFLKNDLESQKKLAEKNNNSFSLQRPENIKTVGNDKWYFGNLNLLLNGVNEFKKIWSDRKLEDNWRRKNKKAVTTSSLEEGATADSGVVEQSIDDIVKSKIKEIPFEKESLAQSNKKINDAMYTMGLIFKDALSDFNKSIEELELLLKRIPPPSNEIKPKIYFHLYVDNHLLKNEARALYYKKLLQKDFPNDELSKSIDKKQIAIIDTEELYYDTTFHYFQESKYDTSIERCNLYKVYYPTEKFKTKMLLIKAICLGRLYKYDEYILALNDLANKYSGTKEGEKAKDLLARLMNSELKRIEDSTLTNENKPIVYNKDESKLTMVGKVDTNSKIVINNIATKDSSIPAITQNTTIIKKDTIKIDTQKVLYEYNLKLAHAYIFVLLNDTKTEDLQTRIGNYNAKNFSVLHLKMLALKLNNKNIFIVQEFTDGNKASFYNKFIASDKEAFQGLGANDFVTAIISNANLAKLITAKDLDGYLKFFKENYKN